MQGGYYQPLQQAVVALLKQLDVKAILDIGCGEGYYTNAMQQVVEQCVLELILQKRGTTCGKTQRGWWEQEQLYLC